MSADLPDDMLSRLHDADPAADITVDLASLRAKVDSLIAADQTITTTVSDAGESSLEVLPVTALRTASRSRRWGVTLGSIAAAAAVGTVAIWGGGSDLFSGATTPQATEHIGASSQHITEQPTPTFTKGTTVAEPEASDRLEQVGSVEFIEEKPFSNQGGEAPAFAVTASKPVSSGEVETVARSLGMGGTVTKTGSGYAVNGSKGERLVVTMGELTSLSFSNPDAMKLECVPVGKDSGVVELPSTKPQPSTDPLPSPSPSTVSPQPSKPSQPSQSLEPEPEPSFPSPIIPTDPSPTPEPSSTMPPPVRPGSLDLEGTKPNPKPTVSPSATPETKPSSKPEVEPNATPEADPKSKENQSDTADFVPAPVAGPRQEVASFYAAPVAVSPRPELPVTRVVAVKVVRQDDEPVPDTPTVSPSKPSAEVSATPEPAVSKAPVLTTAGNKDNNDRGCIMRVPGKAPSPQEAVAQVAKVASALGATVVATQAGAEHSNGLTVVTVPVQMPGQKETMNWRASVSQRGVATISANLGSMKKLGTYKVISQAEAVARLRDPKFGPIDVFDPNSGITTSNPKKIEGRIALVSAKLSTAPIKQKDGSVVSMPVYQITDDQQRVWTVLAVADIGGGN